MVKRGPRLENDVIGAPVGSSAFGPLFDALPSRPEDSPPRPPVAPHPAPGPARPRDPDIKTPVDPQRQAFITRARADLAPKLLERAKREGKKGVTAADTRELAMKGGFITGQEKGRSLSWLGLVAHDAKLCAAGLSGIYSDTGNNLMRYLHPEFVHAPIAEQELTATPAPPIHHPEGSTV